MISALLEIVWNPIVCLRPFPAIRKATYNYFYNIVTFQSFCYYKEVPKWCPSARISPPGISPLKLVNTEKGGVAQVGAAWYHICSPAPLIYLSAMQEIFNSWMLAVDAPWTMQAMERAMNGFRKQFPFSNLPLANWFPGHMAKGTASYKYAMPECSWVSV